MKYMNYSSGHHFLEMVSRVLLPEFEATLQDNYEPQKDIRVEDMLICHNSKPDYISENSGPDQSHIWCPICLETLEVKKCLTNTCAHSICKTCAMQYLETQFRQNHPICCVMCRHPLYVLEASDERIATTFFDFVENCRNLVGNEPLPIFNSTRRDNTRRIARTVDFNDYDNILDD